MRVQDFFAASKDTICKGIGVGGGDCNNPGGIGPVISKVTTAIAFVVGGISIIMIIVGGIRYVMSAGDPNGAKGAKDTIMYSLIGLVIAIAAYAIANWVVDIVT
ncbi:hypothetical protein DYH10_01175 [Candidatus Saccharibacteria bacterium CPR2]|nr:hypothetical protein [Candidatus Saccharibacteria bacterium CPR2]